MPTTWRDGPAGNVSLGTNGRKAQRNCELVDGFKEIIEVIKVLLFNGLGSF